MKIKKKELRKRLAQIPINYPGPDVIPFNYEAEKARVENLCKRLADNEVEARNAVLAELPRFIREVCAPFVKDGALDAAEKQAAAEVDLAAYDAGNRLWDALLKDPSAAKLALLFEKLCLGLYFCMWHSDKPLVQHECAQKIVQLLQAPPTPLLRDLFLRSMLRTLAQYWGKIDQWRMDKYMALVRKLCYQVLVHLVDTVQGDMRVAAAVHSAAAAASTPSKAAADASPSAGKRAKGSKKGAATSEVAPIEDSTTNGSAVSRHPSMLRVGASFQFDVIRSESAGLTMHLCDLMLTEMLRCDKLETPLFVAVALAIPLYAMQRGDYMEKRVMDNFIVPIAAGQLERRSQEFSVETCVVLAAQLEALSVSRGTHFSVRPLMVEAQRLVDNYVGLQTQPDMYEPVTRKDERQKIAHEIRAAEDMKMRMSRLSMKHAAAAGVVRAIRRSAKPQATSKRSARWKK
jgi:hypothetical protein